MGNSQRKASGTGLSDHETRLSKFSIDRVDEFSRNTSFEDPMDEEKSMQSTVDADEELSASTNQSTVTAAPRAIAARDVAPRTPIAEPFVVRRVQRVKEIYYSWGTLGGGSSCSVMKMQERKTGHIYAVKKLKMSVPLHARLFQKEVEMLTTLDHPHIVRYHSHFADRKRFYIATELCSGM